MPTASYRFPVLNMNSGFRKGEPHPGGGLPPKPGYPPPNPSPLPRMPFPWPPEGQGRYMPPTQPPVQLPEPWPSPDIQKRQPYSAGDASAQNETVQITPFMENIYTSMQNIDPEQRSDYLQNSMAKIKERLDRYEFRIARGLPLTPEQQQQYNSMRRSFNDIQNYINDPQTYENYFAKRYAETHQKPAPPAPQRNRNVFMWPQGNIPPSGNWPGYPMG